MENSSPIQIGPKTQEIAFFLGSKIGRENYIGSRVLMLHDCFEPGLLLAEQSIEMMLKSILRIYWNEIELNHDGKELSKLLRTKYQHGLSNLLALACEYSPSLSDISVKSNIDFLDTLTKAYLSVRFGEKGLLVNSTLKVIEKVDFNFFKLYETYYLCLKTKTPKLYVPESLRNDVLKNNIYFTENNIDSSDLAAISF